MKQLCIFCIVFDICRDLVNKLRIKTCIINFQRDHECKENELF
jgi:hypothetical protein